MKSSFHSYGKVHSGSSLSFPCRAAEFPVDEETAGDTGYHLYVAGGFDNRNGRGADWLWGRL